MVRCAGYLVEEFSCAVVGCENTFTFHAFLSSVKPKQKGRHGSRSVDRQWNANPNTSPHLAQASRSLFAFCMTACSGSNWQCRSGTFHCWWKSEGNKRYFFHGHKAATEAAAELTKLTAVPGSSVLWPFPDDEDFFMDPGTVDTSVVWTKFAGKFSHSASDSLSSSSEERSLWSLSLSWLLIDINSGWHSNEPSLPRWSEFTQV